MTPTSLNETSESKSYSQPRRHNCPSDLRRGTYGLFYRLYVCAKSLNQLIRANQLMNFTETSTLLYVDKNYVQVIYATVYFRYLTQNQERDQVLACSS